MEPIKDAVHLCVDMQRIFGKGGVWETPWMQRVRPVVTSIITQFADRTVFTRFITPQTPDQRPGRWRQYYQRWEAATRDRLSSDQLDFCPNCAASRRRRSSSINRPIRLSFGQTSMPFWQKKCRDRCGHGGGDGCLRAFNGARCRGSWPAVIIVEDALCSSSYIGHDALMTMYRTRFQEQIELITADRLSELWKP
jgi:nicotinamidase-related amidase